MKPPAVKFSCRRAAPQECVERAPRRRWSGVAVRFALSQELGASPVAELRLAGSAPGPLRLPENVRIPQIREELKGILGDRRGRRLAIGGRRAAAPEGAERQSLT